MPRVIDYPRSSLKNAIELAKATDSLGGSGRVGMVAETMGLKESGSFSAQIGGAVKYGLVQNQKGVLTITPLYKEYKLAYTDNDSVEALRKAFLHVPLFEKIYQRFAGQRLPTEILDKLLIKEFGVDESMASRVSGYLVEAAKMSKVLGDDDVLFLESTLSDSKTEASFSAQPVDLVEDTKPQFEVNEYTIHFRGPGMDSKISVRDEDDLAIVQATLNKVKKRLSGTETGQ